MKYFILKQGKPQAFTIKELRDENIKPETLVSPDIQDNDGEVQPYKRADKFEELATLFSVQEPKIQENATEIDTSIEDYPDVIIPPIPPIIIENPKSPPPANKEFWVYAIGVLFVLLLAGYWLTNSDGTSKIINCEAKFDSLLNIGEQNIEQPNGESLKAFGLMKDYKNCADTAKIKDLKVKFNSQITTDEAIINDPDIQKRNTQFKEAIKLLNEINTPNQ